MRLKVKLTEEDLAAVIEATKRKIRDDEDEDDEDSDNEENVKKEVKDEPIEEDEQDIDKKYDLETYDEGNLLGKCPQ